jgi:uncharacterized membrane protein
MKHTLCWLSGLLLLSAGPLGCNKSPTGGQGTETFTLSGPATSTNILQGQSESVTITIKPSKNFKETVKLDARPLEDGLKAVFDQYDVKLSGANGDVKLTVTGAPDATEGKHTLRITATPQKGKATSLDVTFNVKTRSVAKFDMTGPATTTNVSQGGSNQVTLALKPGRDFSQNVKLEAKATEKGIKCALDADQVKVSDENKDVKLTVTADADAAPGKRIVLVTATPADGNPKTLELNVNVKESRDTNKVTFDMIGPSGATKVKPGDSNYVTLALKPGKNFKQTVKLEAKVLEGGVKCLLETTSVKLDGDNKNVKLTMTPDNTVETGRRTIRIIATPESGNPKTLDLSFEVTKK